MKILFLIQFNKINRAGLTSLWCRITYNETRKQFSTGTFYSYSFLIDLYNPGNILNKTTGDMNRVRAVIQLLSPSNAAKDKA